MNEKNNSYNMKTNGLKNNGFVANDELPDGKYFSKESNVVNLNSNGIQEKLPDKAE
jgi:hypothetical protein